MYLRHYFYSVLRCRGQVGLQALVPAGEPGLFLAFGGCVGDASFEYGGGGSDEVVEGVGSVLHLSQDLQQAPALSLISFTGSGSRALKMHVVYQGIDAIGA